MCKHVLKVSREFANEVDKLTSEIVIYGRSLAQNDNVFGEINDFSRCLKRKVITVFKIAENLPLK